MNINKAQSGVSLFDKNDSLRQSESRIDVNKPEATNTDKVQSLSLTSQNLLLKPEIEGMQRLSPLDQYRYMAGQEIQSRPVSLRVIPGNPQKTLSMANQVINQAVMPPVFSNPSRDKLTEAIQLKRQAENLIDKAA